MAAESWIAWEKEKQTVALLKKLKEEGIKIVALETGRQTKPLPKIKPKFPLALVVGNEVTGLSKSIVAVADSVVEIPILGRKQSLNVAVAAGIALYRLRN